MAFSFTFLVKESLLAVVAESKPSFSPTLSKALSATDLEARIEEVKERMLAAGASYVIRTMEEIPALIETINARLN